MLPILGCSSSTLDSRILLNVRNTEKTTPEARRKILEIIAWSFESLRTLMEVVLYIFSFKRGDQTHKTQKNGCALGISTHANIPQMDGV